MARIRGAAYREREGGDHLKKRPRSGWRAGAGDFFWGAAGALALLAGCEDAAPALPDKTGPGSEAAIDAAVRDAAGFGNIDLADRQEVKSPELCVDGTAVGAGVMSGLLEGSAPRMTRGPTLDSFGGEVPDWLEGQALPVPSRLLLQGDTLIAVSDLGFFDVKADGAQLHEVRFDLSPSPEVFPADLDADGDEDVVSISLVHVAVPIHDVGTLFTTWERTADGTLEQRASFNASDYGWPHMFVKRDVDGDGDDDFLHQSGPRAFLSDGAFGFTEMLVGAPEEPAVDAFGGVRVFLAEDRNADGAVDLVAYGLRWWPEQAPTSVWLNDGTGRFGTPEVELPPVDRNGPPTSDPRVRDPQFGDVTGDGLSDLVMLDHNETPPRVRIAQSLDAVRFDEAVLVKTPALGFTLADVDGDGMLDIASYFENTLTVHLARGGLEFETVTFELLTHWLNAIAIESATEDSPARLHGLYHATCAEPCDDDCNSCIFDACIDCIAHSDCDEGEACERGECRPR